MENEIFASKFAKVFYNTSKKLYTIKYLSATEDMSNQDWKNLMLSFQALWHKFETLYMISDDRERKFGYDPDLQEWTLKLVIPDWNKLGLKKYVQILPKDFITNLSSEQIDEMGNTRFSPFFENAFVQTYDEAVEWLAV